MVSTVKHWCEEPSLRQVVARVVHICRCMMHRGSISTLGLVGRCMGYKSNKTNHTGGVEIGGDHASLAACAARAARTRQVNIQRLKLLLQSTLRIQRGTCEQTIAMCASGVDGPGMSRCCYQWRWREVDANFWCRGGLMWRMPTSPEVSTRSHAVQEALSFLTNNVH